MADVLLFEELDVSCEQSALNRIEDMMELLSSKLTQISMEGQISRADASALVERYAVRFDERYPLTSFTQSPSPTNLTVAQEGILSAAGQFFMELIKKAGELLSKIYRWILDLLTSRKRSDQRAASRSRQLKEVKKAVHELAAAGIQVPTEQAAVLDKTFEVYRSRYNGLARDMFTSGAMLQLLRNLQPQILQIETTVHLRIEHLKHLITILPVTEADDLAFETNARSSLRPGLGEQIRVSLQKASIPVLRDVTSPRELIGHLVGHLTQLSLLTVDDVPSVDSVQRIIIDGKNGIDEPIVTIPDLMINNMNLSIRNLMELRVVANTRSTPRGRQVVQQLVTTAIDEALGLQAFMNAVNIYSTARDQLFEAVWDYGSALYQVAYSVGMMDPDPAKQRAAQQITERLKVKIK